MEWNVCDKELTKRQKAIVDAWNKIAKYVKENYAGVFEKGVSFEWKHEVYYKIAFGVTADGDAYIMEGSHGWDFDEYYHHPEYEMSQFGAMRRTEEVINDWSKIKTALEQKAEQEKNLYNFTV